MKDANSQEILVVGSGLSAIACAHALIKRGAKVRIIDVGKELDGEQANVVSRLRTSDPSDWKSDDVAAIKDPVKASTGGILKKLVYGSDYVYNDLLDLPNITQEKCVVNFSFAKGGLSNAWGAAVLPYHHKDLDGWPISIVDLEPHYREILSFLPLVACEDDIAKIYPLYKDPNNPLKMSTQAAALLENYQKHRGKINSQGIYCGHPRLAYYSTDSGAARDCVYCNLCVYGCPYDLIYSSKFALTEWERQGKIIYEKNISIRQVEETPNKAIIYGRNLASGQNVEFWGKRVFLATGVYQTAAIVLNSLRAFDHEITLLDSQMFLLPYISLRNYNEATIENAYTLSQIFMEIIDNDDHDVSYHMQGYTYTDAFSKGLEHFIPKKILGNNMFKDQIFGRISILQGFLSSRYSGSLSLRLEKGDDISKNDRLLIKGYMNPESKKIAQKIASRLMKSAHLLGSVPIVPFISLGQPGQSYHTGGSFPMKQKPGDLECDTLGRLNKFRRLHIVDGSVLPTLAGSPFAFTVMANAHRIASETPPD
jgi:choline dehydrogenase-like flavoprotein